MQTKNICGSHSRFCYRLQLRLGSLPFDRGGPLAVVPNRPADAVTFIDVLA